MLKITNKIFRNKGNEHSVTNFSNIYFTNCTFIGTFIKCSFVGTFFDSCTFQDCEFIGCTFFGASFKNSSLDNAVITCCVGNGKDILNIINKNWITITRTRIDVEGLNFRHVNNGNRTIVEPANWLAHPDYSRVYELIDENFIESKKSKVGELGAVIESWEIKDFDENSYDNYK